MSEAEYDAAEELAFHRMVKDPGPLSIVDQWRLQQLIECRLYRDAAFEGMKKTADAGIKHCQDVLRSQDRWLAAIAVVGTTIILGLVFHMFDLIAKHYGP